jgi:hypothetical protein
MGSIFMRAAYGPAIFLDTAAGNSGRYYFSSHRLLQPVRWTRGSQAAGSEEKIALVGFPFGPAVPPEAHFLGIVSAEFVAEKLSVRRTPRLQLPIHDRQRLPAKSATGRSVLFTEDFFHLQSLTPDQDPYPRAVEIPESFTADRS